MSDQMGLLDGVAKEPYALPSMDEIKALPWNGLTAVGSFSGCGGSSLGMRMAGWRVPYAIEFIDEAAKTYRANSPSTHVDERDIREIEPGQILAKIGLQQGELDVYEGSPPCSSFSMAGSREKGWGKEKRYSDSSQRTDDLFMEYVRILEGLNPKAFIAENVPGMMMGNAVEEYAHKVTALMSERGYVVDAKVLNAAQFGVPQDRRRLIFVGYRRDLGIHPNLRTLPGVDKQTTRAALAMAAGVTEDEWTEDTPPTDVEHLEECDISDVALGRSWDLLRDTVKRGGFMDKEKRATCARCDGNLYEHEDVELDGEGLVRAAKCADGEKAQIAKLYFLLQLPPLDGPCQTVTATGASSRAAAGVVHPTQKRKFTPAELRAICSMPQDFILTGTRGQQSERCGRAVPPLFMRAVSARVRDDLLSVR